jgi:eukaryotic-like serine/threonine-protein kinase
MSDPDDRPEENRTVLVPYASHVLLGSSRPAKTIGPSSVPTSYAAMAPRVDGNRIQVGDVLNHIFEVTRFIARGGMGEVFEGVNVNSDERVAIKVMLPALAADANVQAMFRKEARTLTRLAHPALVQYRVLAQEPQLGVLYIVTEYIDGKNLSDVLDSVPKGAHDLVALTRRLADGLRIAHGLGAVHRDISPDNVLLEGGLVEQAKVIDFGIAKDLDPSKGTIVGDGFAGKLNYVAPEQLGDFNREVGPWSDVYSLALVILAVSMGRNVDMGATLVDAVDKRRAGPDLSMVPETIRSVLAAMLKPNPADRLRSMDEVIAALDVVPFAISMGSESVYTPSITPDIATSSAEANSETLFEPAGAMSSAMSTKPRLHRNGRQPTNRKPLIFGGIAAVAVAVIGGAVMMFSGDGDTSVSVKTNEAPIQTQSAVPPEEAARTAVTKALPGVICSWLDVRSVAANGAGVAIGFAGVAGSPAVAQGEIAAAVSAAGIKQANISFDDVAPINQTDCDLLDAYGKIRARGGQALSIPQVKWEMDVREDSKFKDEKVGRPIINLNVEGVSDFAIFGIDSEERAALLTSKQQLIDTIAAGESGIQTKGDGKYAFTADFNKPGWSGFLLIIGTGPFDEKIITPQTTGRGWKDKFAAAAAAKNWQAEMVWFKNVDETPQ